MRYEPVPDRFWRRVKKSKGCWRWIGMTDASGYGRIQVLRRAALAHRISWELANGPIPEGRHVLHLCDNPPCVRPDHLWLGSNADNVADKTEKGRARGASGERNAKAKLTGEQVAEIRRLYRSHGNGRPPKGWPHPTLSQLANKYGVTPSAIYHAYRKWTWP